MDLVGVLYIILNFLVITVVILIILYFYGRRTFGFFTEYGIKGPKPITYIGNLMEIGTKGLINACFEWKHQFGDVYGIFIGPSPNLIISDPEMIREIMIKNFSNFTNRALFNKVEEYMGNMINIAEDDHWKYLRTVLAPSYSSKKMREMVPLIEDVLKTFEKNLNKIADTEEPTDVTVLFSGFTMDVIASTGFGIKVDSQENPDCPVIKIAKKVFNNDFSNALKGMAFVHPFIGTIIKIIKPSLLLGNLTYFVDFCKELVKERKKEKNMNAHKDLLQLMLDAQLEGNEQLDKKTEQALKLENVTDWRTKRGLTDVEIIAQCMVFFLAGYETTANTLSFFAHSIAMYPEIQDLLCLEIHEELGQESPNYDNVQKLTYLDMCMDETLRQYPIAISISRKTKQDCIIKGIKIPKNTGVIFPLFCLHYDRRYWSDPLEFKPRRFSEENKAVQTPFTYLPFGDGPRMCAGMRLAKLEFKIAVVQMLRKFRLVTCDKTEERIKVNDSGILRAKNGIWLKIEHR